MKSSLVAALGVLALVGSLTAQAQETFKTRLAPVPIDERTTPVIKGQGSVSVVLSGSKLTVSGKFEGMRSPATTAHLLQSKMTGVPGATIADLTVSKAPAGEISGTVELMPGQVDALRKGLLYVVVNSEGAPDGNLWGWLLK